MSVTSAPAPAAPPSAMAAVLERLHLKGATAAKPVAVGEWRWLWPIFIAGLLLRVLFLEQVPNSVTADELDFFSNALQVLTGQGPGLFGLDWTPEPALGLHFMVGSMVLFGQTLFAERLVAAVLTALAIIPFYALARRVASQQAAVLATILFAAARWLLLFARSGWNNGYIVLYLLLAAWCLTLALERERLRYWLGFGASLALLLLGYFAGRAVVVAFAAYLLLLLAGRLRAADRAGFLRLAQGGGAAAAVCLLLILPQIPAVVQHWDLFNRRTADVFILNQPLPSGETRASELGQQAWQAVRSFLLEDPTLGTAPFDSVSQRDARYKAIGSSWLDPVSAGLFVIGMVIALARRRGLALWWCLLLIPLGITQVLSVDTPDGARALPAIAPMFIFVALTIDALLAMLPQRRWLWEAMLAASVLVAVYNVATYVRWVDAPTTIAARQPGVPVGGFYTWRDFQLARLRAHQGVMPASEYDTLDPAAIAAEIAGVPDLAAALNAQPQRSSQPSIPNGPPENGPPQQNMARDVGVVGEPGTAAGQFSEPRSVAADAQGDLYVVDSKRQKVLKFGPTGQFLLEWGAASGPTANLQPWAVVAAPDNTVFVEDVQSGQVFHFDGQGKFLGMAPVAAPTGATRGMAAGLDSVVYLAQTPANRVARFSLQGGALPSLGANAPKLLDQPTSAVAEQNGVVFVYEPDSGRLVLLGPDGRLLFTLAAPKMNTIDAGHLAILPDGRVVLADAAGHRLIFYAPDGRLLGYAPFNGMPSGIAVTPSGTLAVTDLQNKVVRDLTPNPSP